MKMDPAIRARWVEALRSGKYDQTTENLHIAGEGHCCLGVLCELAVEAGAAGRINQGDSPVVSYASPALAVDWDKLSKIGLPTSEWSSAVLPRPVYEWAGLDDSDMVDPTVELDGQDHTLTSLNDDDCLSFDEIAALIEKDGHNHEEVK